MSLFNYNNKLLSTSFPFLSFLPLASSPSAFLKGASPEGGPPKKAPSSNPEGVSGRSAASYGAVSPLPPTPLGREGIEGEEEQQKKRELRKKEAFSEVVSITYEEIGLFPRSFSRVLDRFLKQIFSDVENLVIQEYRFYRYLFLTTLKCLLILIFIPVFVNFLAKTYIVRPLTEYVWNTKQTEIFLNSYQQKRAFAELKDFEEKIYFESLIYPKSTFFLAPLPLPVNGGPPSLTPKGYETRLPLKGPAPLLSLRERAAESAGAPLRGRPQRGGATKPPFESRRDSNESLRDSLGGLTPLRGARLGAAATPLSLPKGEKGQLPLPLPLPTGEGEREGEGRDSQGVSLVGGPLTLPHTGSEAALPSPVGSSEGPGGFVGGRGSLPSPKGKAAAPSLPTLPLPLPLPTGEGEGEGATPFGESGGEARAAWGPRTPGWGKPALLPRARPVSPPEGGKQGAGPPTLPSPVGSSEGPGGASLPSPKGKAATPGLVPHSNPEGVSEPLSPRGQGQQGITELNDQTVPSLIASSSLSPSLRNGEREISGERETEYLINSYTLKSSLFVYQTIEADKNIQQRYQEKTIELAQRYNDQSIEAITNLFADLISLCCFFYLLYALEIQINITKSFLLEVFFGLDDSKKSLLILLVTDLLVGYHSSNLWELFFEFVFHHYGLPESQTGIFLLVATLPVLLDVLFKYLIFRHLNRSSPATVATYHAMIE